MRILDRYLMRTFLFSYLVCFFALTGLYVVVESFEIAGELIEDDKPWTDILVTLPVFAACKTPIFFYQVAPAVTLMAGIFTVTRLARTNELLPIKAAGISLYRVFLPIFVLAFISAIVVYFDQELLVAGLRDKIAGVDRMVKGSEDNERDRVLLDDSFGNRIYISEYLVEQKIMYGVNLTRFFEDTHSVSLTAHAEKAFWKRSPVDQVERWHLSNGTIQDIDKLDSFIVKVRAFLEDGLVLITRPEDELQDGREYLLSDLAPEDVRAAEPVEFEFMSTSELLDRAREHKGIASAEVLVTIQRRFSWPLSTVLLLLVGLPFAVGSENRNTFLAMGMCLIIVLAFFIIETVCRQLGEAGSLSSYLAGWLPTLILGASGLYLFDGIRT